MVKKVGEIIRSKIIVVTFAMIAVVMSFIMSNKMLKNDSNVATITDPEILRAMTYEQVTEEDRKIENCDFVQFSAFFLRDLYGDGIAEDLKGTCKKYKFLSWLLDKYQNVGEFYSANFTVIK